MPDDETFVPEPEPAEALEAEPAPETWQVDRAEYEQMRNFIGAAAPVIGQLAQQFNQQQYQPNQHQYYEQQPQEPQGPAFDPFEPETVQNYIQQQVQSGVEQALQYGLSPYEPLLETVAAVEGERQAREALEALGADVGDFDQDAAMILAAGLMSQGSVMPDHALRVSAGYLNELELRIREDERKRYADEIANIRSAPGEHPVATAPSASEMETIPTGPGRYREAIENAIARRNPRLPVG